MIWGKLPRVGIFEKLECSKMNHVSWGFCGTSATHGRLENIAASWHDCQARVTQNYQKKKKSDLSQNIHRIDSSRGNWCPEGGFRWRLQVNYKWQWQTDISRKWNEIRWPINSHQWIVGNLLTTHFAAIQYLIMSHQK